MNKFLMRLLNLLFGKKDSKEVEKTPIDSVETKIVPKEEEVGVPADGDQVVRGE